MRNLLLTAIIAALTIGLRPAWALDPIQCSSTVEGPAGRVHMRYGLGVWDWPTPPTETLEWEPPVLEQTGAPPASAFRILFNKRPDGTPTRPKLLRWSWSMVRRTILRDGTVVDAPAPTTRITFPDGSSLIGAGDYRSQERLGQRVAAVLARRWPDRIVAEELDAGDQVLRRTVLDLGQTAARDVYARQAKANGKILLTAFDEDRRHRKGELKRGPMSPPGGVLIGRAFCQWRVFAT